MRSKTVTDNNSRHNSNDMATKVNGIQRICYTIPGTLNKEGPVWSCRCDFKMNIIEYSRNTGYRDRRQWK